MLGGTGSWKGRDVVGALGKKKLRRKEGQLVSKDWQKGEIGGLRRNSWKQ